MEEKKKMALLQLTVPSQNGHQVHPPSVTHVSQVRDEQRKTKIVTVFQPLTEKDQGTAHGTWAAPIHYAE